jgi:hypothetical protein
MQQGAVAPIIKPSRLKVSAEKPRFVAVAGGCLSVFMVQPTAVSSTRTMTLARRASLKR